MRRIFSVQIQSMCQQQNGCDSEIEIHYLKDSKPCGKGENAGYQHFVLFPQYFQKDCLKSL